LAGYDPQTDTVHFSLDVPAGQYKRFSGAAISSDGLRVAVLRTDKAIEIFATDDAPEPEKLISKSDETKRPELALTQGHGDLISSIAISPDGTLLATAGQDYRTHIWEAAKGRQLRSIEEGDHIRQIAFSPDSKFILSVGGGMALISGELLTENGSTPCRMDQPSGRIICLTAGKLLLAERRIARLERQTNSSVFKRV
jgi:WD40 repeat protein